MSTPLNPNQPANVQSLVNKYQSPNDQFASALQTVSPEVRNALIDLDMQRVQRGSAPLTQNQSALGLLSAQSGQEATPYKPAPSLWQQVIGVPGNAIKDAGDIAGNIWRIPFQLEQEGEQIATGLPDALSKAKGPGGYLNLPGVRLIPGAQTLSAALPGGLPAGSILQHPLMTALDIAPIAGAKLFGEAAEGGKLSAIDLAKQTPVGEAIGAAKESAIGELAKTQPGRWYAQTFTPEARKLSSMVNTGQYDVAKEASRMVQSGMSADDVSGMLADVNIARNRIAPPDQQLSLLEPEAQSAVKTETRNRLQQYAGEVQQRVGTQLADTWGNSAQQTIDSLQAAGKSQSEIDAVINRDFVDPAKGQQYQGPLFDSFRDRGQLVPRNIAENLRRFAKPVGKGPLSVFDPLLNIFRTFVLPLSPRWHFNNIVGGAMMVGLEAPQAFRQIGNAWDLLRKGEAEVGGKRITTDELPSVVDRGQAAFTNKQMNYEQGRFMANVRDKLIAEHPDLVPHFAGISKAGALGKYIIGKSFDFNGFFDDLFRTTSYLEGYTKELGKGATKAEAEEAGIALATKTMPAWQEMTPLERGIMKNVFPFYGFTQKIVRNALSYPVDHPYRTAVLNSFARAEETDRKQGLPGNLRDLFLLGSPDAKGNQFGLSLGAANPYRDVGNFFTMAGFTSQLAPQYQILLQRMGVNTAKAQPDTYQDLAYNPETGKMEYKAPSVAGQLIGNIIPQTKALGALLGANKEFKSLKNASPSAQTNYLLSSLGLPVLGKEVNPVQEQIKSEVQRETGQQQAISEALKTGDLSGAIKNYPAGIATVRQLQQLSPTLLQPYQPNYLPTALKQVKELEGAQ